jgi:uncharacterized protein (TIGR00297 family)
LLAPPFSLLIGFLLSLLIGAVAYRRQSLSRGGVIGAVLVGTLTFGLGGLAWAIVVVVFFVSSSLLTHYRSAQKAEFHAQFAKGGRRDFYQVMANGGAAVLLAVASAALPSGERLFFAAFIGAMATVTADTWATELGLLSTQKPRMITTWQSAHTGESGAVSALGLTASATGALVIGTAALCGKFAESFFSDVFIRAWVWLPTAALLGGWLGSVTDSLLGATLQALYYCAPDDQFTEKMVHTCGRQTIHTRGLVWLTNDMVNFVSSIAGALIAAAVYVALGQ